MPNKNKKIVLKSSSQRVNENQPNRPPEPADDITNKTSFDVAGDELRHCAYNNHHLIISHRLARHHLTCVDAKWWPGMFTTCQYNVSHVVKKRVINAHERNCPDKAAIELSRPWENSDTPVFRQEFVAEEDWSIPEENDEFYGEAAATNEDAENEQVNLPVGLSVEEKVVGTFARLDIGSSNSQFSSDLGKSLDSNSELTPLTFNENPSVISTDNSWKTQTKKSRKKPKTSNAHKTPITPMPVGMSVSTNQRNSTRNEQSYHVQHREEFPREEQADGRWTVAKSKKKKNKNK